MIGSVLSSPTNNSILKEGVLTVVDNLNSNRQNYAVWCLNVFPKWEYFLLKEKLASGMGFEPMWAKPNSLAGCRPTRLGDPDIFDERTRNRYARIGFEVSH